jgi:hypothetical protein
MIMNAGTANTRLMIGGRRNHVLGWNVPVCAVV